MMEKKIEQGDLAKAITALQELAKGHSSRGTATTAVETMVGESGSTQLFHTDSNSDPGSWAGSSWRGEGWEDMIEANGTDLRAVRKLGKSIATGIMAKLAKGEALTARELGFVNKGGLNFLKDDDKKADKADKALPPKKDDDDVEKAAAHDDEEEDKKLIRDMVKPEAVKKSEVQKSLLDYSRENADVNAGFEVSEFLSGFVQVMNKSLQSMEARITDRIISAIAKSDADAGEVSKSMAGALASLGEVLAAHTQRIDQLEAAPARAPKSALIKSGAVPSPVDGGGSEFDSLTKSQVTERLLDLVKKSEATPHDVIKYDSTGFLSPELMRKVVGR